MDPASGLIPLVKLRDALDGHMQAGLDWFEDVYDGVMAPEAEASGGLGLKASIAAQGFPLETALLYCFMSMISCSSPTALIV
jgi:hypothetical protein